MLRFIKIYLNNNKDSKIIIEKLERLKQFLKNNQVELEWGGLEKRNHDSLYLTDDPVTLNDLLKQGYYVAGLLHEGNKDAHFCGNCYLLELPEKEEDFDVMWIEGVYRRLAGLPLDILETKHFLLRESTVADVDEFYKIYEEKSITRYMDNLFQNPLKEKEYMEKYIKEIYGFYGYGIWTVIKKDTTEIIGRAGLSVRAGYDLPELGYVIGVPWQKKGYAYEICEGILSYAKDTLQFEEVQAFVRPLNLSSIRLLEKLNFSLRGETTISEEKHLIYRKNLEL